MEKGSFHPSCPCVSSFLRIWGHGCCTVCPLSSALQHHPACLQKFNRISDLRSPCMLNPITAAGAGALRGGGKSLANVKLIPMKYPVKHHSGQNCVWCKLLFWLYPFPRRGFGTACHQSCRAAVAREIRISVCSWTPPYDAMPEPGQAHLSQMPHCLMSLALKSAGFVCVTGKEGRIRPGLLLQLKVMP